MNIKKIVSILLGLLPVIMIFKVPGTDFGLGTLCIAGLSLWGIVWMLYNGKINIKCFLLLFVLYIIFRNIGNGLAPLFYGMAFIVILACLNNCFDYETIIKVVEITAILASIIIIIQLMLHFLFGFNFSPLVSSMLLSEYTDKIYGFSISASGSFRAAAFFLEPAHYCQYSIIALVVLLMRGNKSTARIIKIILLTIGMIGSTSGIGLIMCCGLYLYYILKLIHKQKGTNKILYLIAMFILVIIVVILALKVDSIRYSFERIFYSDSSGYNAISGRSVHWNATVGSLEGKDVLFGIGPIVNHITGFITGANEIIYYYGYLGLVLLILSMSLIVLKAYKNKYCDTEITIMLCCCYFMLFWAADVVGFISISFWLSILVSNKVLLVEKGK